MENVTDRVSNPFGMRPPEEYPPVDDGPDAVYGYGDANADFYVVGANPTVHGGETTGVPFTETVGARRLQRVLHDVGFLAEPYSDRPDADNLFVSYLFMPRLPNGRSPDEGDYETMERFFDAEFRAINPHVVLPVGATAIDRVLESYTTLRRKFTVPIDEDDVHATEARGRGFLVVPVKEPANWTVEDEAALRDRLTAILNSDYRQTKGVSTIVG
ncbi:uracil-DNA glycosylase family protein [Haloarchaeobius sp. HRN-SO-5]|uniref:uracil-DNA glycosylase family protein n=1 Tax=Haloarchaeobius sp. HRN-SO-5 TaxID=3446118 RepID=UPI003EBAC52D